MVTLFTADIRWMAFVSRMCAYPWCSCFFVFFYIYVFCPSTNSPPPSLLIRPEEVQQACCHSDQKYKSLTNNQSLDSPHLPSNWSVCVCVIMCVLLSKCVCVCVCVIIGMSVCVWLWASVSLCACVLCVFVCLSVCVCVCVCVCYYMSDCPNVSVCEWVCERVSLCACVLCVSVCLNVSVCVLFLQPSSDVCLLLTSPLLPLLTLPTLNQESDIGSELYPS